MGFSKQEYWIGLPFPSPGDLPNPGIEPVSPALKADSLPLSDQGSQRMEGNTPTTNPPPQRGAHEPTSALSGRWKI